VSYSSYLNTYLVLWKSPPQSAIKIQEGSIIGYFQIQTLQSKYTYMPKPIKESEFDSYSDNTLALANINARFELSEKIANLCNLRK
jgi:hypothetical protein